MVFKSLGDVVVIMSSSILFQGLQEVKNIPQKIINDTKGTRDGKENRLSFPKFCLENQKINQKISKQTDDMGRNMDFFVFVTQVCQDIYPRGLLGSHICDIKDR